MGDALNVADLKAQVSALMQKLQAVEAEIEARSSRLHGPGQPGLTERLTDAEGFPRADVDVAAVRADRHRIICLSNDHKQLQSQIEGLMLQLHAAERERRACLATADNTGNTAAAAAAAAAATATATPTAVATSTAAAAMPPPVAAAAQPMQSHEDKKQKLQNGIGGQPTTVAPSQAGVAVRPMDAEAPATTAAAAAAASEAATHDSSTHYRPFAIVDEVTDGSPAAAAGIKLGDQLCRFGDVVAVPGGGELQQVAQTLAAHEGQQVEAVLLRQGQQLQLQLVPARWAGRGLLGCHLRPVVR